MPYQVPSTDLSPGGPGEWTIVHRRDPAMDLHLALMVDAADDALRDRRSFERLIPQPPAPAGSLLDRFARWWRG